MKFKEFSFACYPITDVARARAFYEGVLGLKASSEWVSPESAFIEYSIGPDTLAIGMGSPNASPGKTGATVALEAEDFDGAVAELRSKKAKFLMEPSDFPSCNMALIEDPDGNQIMIHKRKAK
jgi:predicted enzyme related to lactoylglutathione lyase